MEGPEQKGVKRQKWQSSSSFSPLYNLYTVSDTRQTTKQAC